MQIRAAQSQSYWMATASAPSAPPLRANEKAGVLVIGAGLAGLSTAYELACTGHDVVVIERGELCRGMTARTSAHLTWVSDDDFWRLIAIHGAPKARLYYDSHAAAIDQIERIQREENIACEFARIDGYVFAPRDKEGLTREAKAMANLDIPFAWADRPPIPGVDYGRCLRFAHQARFHPLLYLNGLVEAIKRRGGRIYSGTAATNITETSSKVTVTTHEGHSVRAKVCVVATNSPVLIKVNVHEKQTPYRSYVLAAEFPSGAADALLWDTLEPYHYVRLQPGADGVSDLLIFGGEDHKTGEASDMVQRFRRLEVWGRKHFPNLGKVVHRWSGQLLEPRDCAAFIGRKPGSRSIYFATGDSGDGLTHTVVASMLIRDLVLENENPWSALYNPARRPAKPPAKFHRDANVKGEAPRAIANADRLKNGEGAIVRQHGDAIATYRDDRGRLSQCSAKCTHAGCTVQWNSFERCWDCPCHGSHFAPDGTAINAPAVKPLETHDDTKKQPAHAHRLSKLQASVGG